MYQANQLFGITPNEYYETEDVVIDAFFKLSRMNKARTSIDEALRQHYISKGMKPPPALVKR